MLSGVCRRLSSSITLHGGPVALRPVRATLSLNNMTNLHQLTLLSTTSCPTTWRSYHGYRLLWRHFTLCIGNTGQSCSTRGQMLEAEAEAKP